MSIQYPAFGICGFSGSGKTTVIEAVIRQLTLRGLTIGVVKHDVHGLNIDHEGKDTDRFYKAGADVVIRGPEQCFFRGHRRNDAPLAELLKSIGPYYDLILVEGHKSTALDQKVWLSGEAGDDPPPEACNIRRVLRRDEDRVQIVMSMIDDWLPGAWCSSPVYAGILIGGKSSRFGSPKHLVREENGKSWLEQILAKTRSCVDNVVLLGAADIPPTIGSMPVLADVPGVKGPLTGMLAAMRWNPLTSWVFIPCDVPLLSEDALVWLLNQRVPGIRAVLPRLAESQRPEPLLAYYDFRAAPLLEAAGRPADIAEDPHVITPVVPEKYQSAWRNVNTRDELALLRGTRDSVKKKMKLNDDVMCVSTPCPAPYSKKKT